MARHDVEDSNRIGVLLQLPQDHANAAALVMVGDTLIATLQPNGDLRIAGRIITSDGQIYEP